MHPERELFHAIVRVSVECDPQKLDAMLLKYRAEKWTIEAEHRTPVWVQDRYVTGFQAVRCE